MSSAARLRWFRLFIRLGISGLSLLVFALHVASAPRFEIIDRIENYLYDVRVLMTMPGTIDERIVIVDIDEASQLELGRWPWPRDTLATIVDRLFDGDPHGPRERQHHALHHDHQPVPRSITLVWLLCAAHWAIYTILIIPCGTMIPLDSTNRRAR